MRWMSVEKVGRGGSEVWTALAETETEGRME